MINPEEFLKKRWYVQGFNATPNLISHAHVSSLKLMPIRLGYGYKSMLISFKNDFCEYCYDLDSLEYLEKIVSENLKKDPKFMDKLEEKQRELWKEGISFSETVRKTDLKKLSKKELIELYHKVFNWYAESVSVSHIIEAFILWDEKLKNKISKYYEHSGKKKTLNEYLTILTQAVRPSYTNDERIELLKILKFIKSNPELESEFKSNEHILEFIDGSEIQRKLESHKEKFYWVRCNYAYGEEAPLSYFVNELHDMIVMEVNPEEELKKEEFKYKKNKEEKEKAISDLKINDPETLTILTVSEQVLHFQDDRKKAMMTIMCNMSKVLYEIAERYNLKKRLSLYLRVEEINEELLSKITNEELEKRRNGCVFIYVHTSKNGIIDCEGIMLVGKEYEEFMKKLSKGGVEEEINDFRGMCASTGIASGKVRICRTKEDLDKFEKGEILVASMTRPEFVSVMKKASAIVTDEGGITCHAAIIARELKIPCVIGTKIATKILSNGDQVEVRAHHGLIKILRKD